MKTVHEDRVIELPTFQNVFEIMLFAFACFLVLAIIQWRSTKKSRLRCTPLRSKLLSVVVGLELGGLFLQIMNMIRFIKTGFSVEAVCFLSEVRILNIPSH